MSATKTGSDNWNSGDYQHSASFVPKLAGKVVQWLDLRKDDVVLDIGCGDGILNLEFSKVLAQGTGSVHGIDSSAAMIEAAQQLCKDTSNASFEVLDATQLSNSKTLQKGTFTKAFSNAALHWILRNPSTRASVFPSIAQSLIPGGVFALEMGGLGNVSEMRTALLLSLSRHVPFKKVLAADPWFFPDEQWLSTALEGAGFEVLRCEREWRPTTADRGGVEGWVRLFGKGFLDVLEDEETREEVVKECAAVLREVCRMPGGGESIGYVRLRALAKKK